MQSLDKTSLMINDCEHEDDLVKIKVEYVMMYITARIRLIYIVFNVPCVDRV